MGCASWSSPLWHWQACRTSHDARSKNILNATYGHVAQNLAWAHSASRAHFVHNAQNEQATRRHKQHTMKLLNMNITDSSYDTSARGLDRQHFASSKFAPWYVHLCERTHCPFRMKTRFAKVAAHDIRRDVCQSLSMFLNQSHTPTSLNSKYVSELQTWTDDGDI